MEAARWVTRWHPTATRLVGEGDSFSTEGPATAVGVGGAPGDAKDAEGIVADRRLLAHSGRGFPVPAYAATSTV